MYWNNECKRLKRDAEPDVLGNVTPLSPEQLASSAESLGKSSEILLIVDNHLLKHLNDTKAFPLRYPFFVQEDVSVVYIHFFHLIS